MALYYWRTRHARLRIRGPSELVEIEPALEPGEVLADVEVVPEDGQTYGALVSGGDWTPIPVSYLSPPEDTQGPTELDGGEAPVQPPVEEDEEPTEIRCPFCSELILSTARKCKHCGEWLREARDDHPKARGTGTSSTQEQRTDGGTSSLGCLFLVLAALCLLYAFGMDVSVQAGAMRVANLSLMDERRNLIIVAGFLAVLGAVLFANSQNKG